uniref:Protein-tyrosine phosphatase n=1 Tax=Strongyloides venezuelensis TaxID=75913 RepID=A0A0K0F3E0_STRVS
MDNYECLDNNQGGDLNCPPPPPPDQIPPTGSPHSPNEAPGSPAFFTPSAAKANQKQTAENDKYTTKNICRSNNINANLKRNNGTTQNGDHNSKITKVRDVTENIVHGENDELIESPQLQIQAESINEFYEVKCLIDSVNKPGEDKHKNDIKQKILGQYKAIRSSMNFVFDFMANPTKNRFTNVMMFNEGNCFLKDEPDPEERYYHANKISTEQGTYIMAQAPLNNTVKTFWSLIWEQDVCIIASFCDYSNHDDCQPYFDLSLKKKKTIGHFIIQTVESKSSSPAIIFKLKVYNKKTKQGRIVNIINWTGWEVNKVPSMSKLLGVMSIVWKMEHVVEVVDKRDTGPILVHGVSGSRRTSTFVAINIICKQLRDTKKCSIITTAILIRRYRHNAIRDHLMFAIILMATMHYAASINQVNKKDASFLKASKSIISFISTNKAAQKATSDAIDKK